MLKSTLSRTRNFVHTGCVNYRLVSVNKNRSVLRPFSTESEISSMKSEAEKCDIIKNNFDVIGNLMESSERIRKILIKLTEFDLAKIYLSQMRNESFKKNEIKYITNEDLKLMREKAQKHYEDEVIIPPLPIAKGTESKQEEFISSDEGLDVIDLCTLTFVDISKTSLTHPTGMDELKEHSRRVWERRHNGELWLSGHGSDHTRDRAVKSVYKKLYRDPAGVDLEVFEEEKFNQLLYAGKFNYLLTLAYQNHLIDDPKLKVHLTSIFNFICEHSLYAQLKSTRFFPVLLLHILSDSDLTNGYLQFVVNKRNVKEIIGLFTLRNTLVQAIDENNNGNEINESDLLTESKFHVEENETECTALKLLEDYCDQISPAKSGEKLKSEVLNWSNEVRERAEGNSPFLDAA